MLYMFVEILLSPLSGFSSHTYKSLNMLTFHEILVIPSLIFGPGMGKETLVIADVTPWHSGEPGSRTANGFQ